MNLSTLYWPQENGQVERQNRSLLKRLRISHAMKRDWKKDLEEYLTMYYTTPHTTTGKTPTQLCLGRTIRSKIPSMADVGLGVKDEEVRDEDTKGKLQRKEKEDARRQARVSEIQVGDIVIMKNLHPKNKLSTIFGAERYEVMKTVGSTVMLKEEESGKLFERNVAHVKKAVADSEENRTLPQVEVRRSARLAKGSNGRD